ncbi:hypothetical protein C2S51_012751 [Perilla frutescens var. frutescens]|nr:hypothetical protein C2S51_012751 [Perilla frutescens var. frutescens]
MAMATLLSSSFIPQNPQQLKASSSSRMKSNTSHHPIIITAKSTSNIFQPHINKLTNQTMINPSKKSLFAIMFNALDNFICDFIDLPLHPSLDPKHVLPATLLRWVSFPPPPATRWRTPSPAASTAEPTFASAQTLSSFQRGLTISLRVMGCFT